MTTHLEQQDLKVAAPRPLVSRAKLEDPTMQPSEHFPERAAAIAA